MPKNIGVADRVLRIIVALVIAYLLVNGTIVGAWAIVLGVIGVALLVTSSIGYCPAYGATGVSTRRSGHVST